MRTFTGNGVSFRYPAGWHIAGFSTTNLPARLAVASYSLSPKSVEGDCGGVAAVRRLPPDGALVLLIDYGRAWKSFEAAPPRFRLDDGAFAEYECFGPSTMFRFSIRGRDLQAHVALGREAGADIRRQALAVLDSLMVKAPPQ